MLVRVDTPLTPALSPWEREKTGQCPLPVGEG